MYFFHSVTKDMISLTSHYRSFSKTKRLVLGSLFSCLAALFQMSGDYLPVFGYLISPLATAPILFCTASSITFGLTSYILTNLLLFLIAPTELMIFPFTTGLLGLGIGTAFHFFKKRLSLIICSAITLTTGIAVLLYALQFPVLGPAISNHFSYSMIGSIFLFTILYSWIWVDIFIICVKRIVKFL